MAKYNIVLGFLFFAIAITANANCALGKGKPSCTPSCPSSCVQPPPQPLVVCSSCPETNSNTQNTTEVIGVTALAAIENTRHSMEQAINAARHSMEESKEFYERYAYILTAIIFAAVTGGFAYLRTYVGDIAEKRATTNLTETQTAIKKLDEELRQHLSSREKFRNDMKIFQEETKNEITASLIFMPKYVELTAVLNRYGKDNYDGHKAHRIAVSTLEACEKALSHNPTNKFLLVLIYSNYGIANHILGRYDAAYKNMAKSLEYDGDRPATLYNIACSLCKLGKMDEAWLHLKRSIDLEPDRADQAWGDPDFDLLRTNPEFLKIAKKLDASSTDTPNTNT